MYNQVGSNNKHKGENAQKFVIAALARYDVEVALPMSDNLPFDLIAIYKGHLFKVQVKSSSKSEGGEGSISFKCTSSNWWKKTTKKYTSQDTDILIGYDYENGGVYLLSPHNFVNRRSFTIRKTSSKNNQKKRMNLAADYELSEKRLKEVFVK